MAEIKPIRPNPIGQTFADWLYSGRDFANKAELPYLGGIGNLLFGESPEVIEDWAYGFQPYSGAGQTTQLDPRMVDVAGLPLPYAGAYYGAKGLYKGARKLDDALGKITPTPDDYGFQTPKSIKDELGVEISDKRVPEYNWFSGQNLKYGPGLEDGVKDPLFLTSDQHALDYYSGAAWDTPGAVNYPFKFNPKRTLDIDTSEGNQIFREVIEELNLNEDDILKSMRSIGDVEPDVRLHDALYNPKVREELRKRGYDSVYSAMDDLGPDSTLPNHDFMVPLDLFDVRDLTDDIVFGKHIAK